MIRPNRSTAVMASRRSPPRALDYFPTPPWATRAGLELARGQDHKRELMVCDPACGGGHMAHVMAEIPELKVRASDVYDYGWGHEVMDFLDSDWGFLGYRPEWIVTNPPFAIAERFAQLALARASRGVALLVRTAFLEGERRHRALFSHHPPRKIAIFSERASMVHGRWDPKASLATSYCWLIWVLHDANWGDPQFVWIPPGTRGRLTRPDDVARFAEPADAPLFDGDAG